MSRWGVHMWPLKIWGEETQIIASFADGKSTLWAAPFFNATEIEKWLRRPYQTWWGRSHHLWLRSSVLLGHYGVGQVNVRIDITWAVYMTAGTRCLILGVGFPGQPIRRRRCGSRNCSALAIVKLGTGRRSSRLVVTPRLSVFRCYRHGGKSIGSGLFRYQYVQC